MVGCLEQQQKEKSCVAENISKLENSTTSESISQGEIIQQIDCLEKLFNNDNYYFIENRDTQFVYFTRINKENIFTHFYQMKNGDSTQLKIESIHQNQNNIEWVWQGKKIFLDSASNETARWKYDLNGSDNLEFNKNSEGQISVKKKNNKSLRLFKIPQISLFLSRSWYDNKKGTHLAFDTSNFTIKL